MDIEILGSGCARCRALEKAVREALAQSGRTAEVKHVTDFAAIAARGAMSMPALVIDGKIVLSGRVPSPAEITGLLPEQRPE